MNERFENLHLALTSGLGDDSTLRAANAEMDIPAIGRWRKTHRCAAILEGKAKTNRESEGDGAPGVALP